MISRGRLQFQVKILKCYVLLPVVFRAAFAVEVVLTVFGNVLVLLAFAFEKKLRSNFNLYLLNLAVTDLLVALTAMPLYTVDYILAYFPFDQVRNKMFSFGVLVQILSVENGSSFVLSLVSIR